MAFFCFAFIPIVAIVVAIFLLIRQKTRPRIDHPQCGNCGYRVEGLEAMRCPECGSDLRQVGIVTPAQSGRTSPWVWIVLWTCILPLPAMILTSVVGSLLPTILNNERSLFMQPLVAQAGYTQIVCIMRGSGRSSTDLDRGELRLTIGDGRADAVLLFTIEQGALMVKDPGLDVRGASAGGGRQARTLDVGMLTAWIASSTGRSDDAELLAEAEECLQYMTAARTSQVITSGAGSRLTSTGVSTISYLNVHRWYVAAAVVFWSLLWIAGIVWFIRAERKHREAASLGARSPGSP